MGAPFFCAHRRFAEVGSGAVRGRGRSPRRLVACAFMTALVRARRRERSPRRSVAPGSMTADEFRRLVQSEPDTADLGHRLGPALEEEELLEWARRFPNVELPEDLVALLRRWNGIHLWADRTTGRAYAGLAPLREWRLARHVMFGPDADEDVLEDRYLAISYHVDRSAFFVLNVESGRYFLMDSCGPDETCPLGSDVQDLLTATWNHRIS